MRRFGHLTLVWYDGWEERHGLTIEVRAGRRVYSVSFGFGRIVRFMRGQA